MNCWDCRHQQLAGEGNALGVCMFFARLGRTPARIPPQVVDVGCKFFAPKPAAPQETKPNGESHDRT